MSDLIHLLPDSVANQIAAGEVIQRPASVVKELVENSIDAGAKTVHVLITDAGKTCIQVIDDGKGMSETDARMAFERHATSKIHQASDLFALGTFGFRGEALPSIAAVSQVELHTRTEEDELGTVIYLEGSKVVRQEVDACARGSNFLVKNLFFNVPARRKFLKSDQTELSNIITEVERVALVNNEVTFTLHHNGTELLNLVQTGQRQRVMQLFGKKSNQELLGIHVETSIANISGFVGGPESARKKGSHQFFFVNGRYMRHPYFHKAVQEAFSNLIPENEQVSYFIYFDVDPSRIDVNIHPTKTEIKFEDEHAIWQILVASIREVLGRSHAVPTIDFDTTDKPDIPVIPKERNFAPPQPETHPNYNPFQANREIPERKAPINWEKLYETIPPAPIEQAELFKNETEKQASTYDCIQFNGQYIVTPVGTGLMLIEQHRAHVRILFDRYMHQFQGKHGVSQGMLFPEMVQVSPSEAVQMDLLLADFGCLGFEINNMGGGSFSIQGIPPGIEGLDPCKLVIEMLSSALEKKDSVKSDVQSNMALTMARSAAIVVGQMLTNEEMNAIVAELLACSMPNYTPDGKKTLSIIDEQEFSKIFS